MIRLSRALGVIVALVLTLAALLRSRLSHCRTATRSRASRPQRHRHKGRSSAPHSSLGWPPVACHGVRWAGCDSRGKL